MLRRNSRQQQTTVLPNYSGCTPAANNGKPVFAGYSNFPSSANKNGDNSFGFGSSSSRSGTYKKEKSVSNLVEVLPPLTVWMKKSTSWLSLGFAFFLMVSCYYQAQFDWVKREFGVDSLQQLVKEYQSGVYDESSQKRTALLEEMNAKLQKEKKELRMLYEARFKDERNDDSRYSVREDALKKQIDVLKAAASRESKRAVTDKFGPGPHYVEFTFQLPSDEKEMDYHFVVETAPLEFMPHAVHLFLEQVYHELWDESWFYINGPHVLQAGPMLEEGEETDGESFENDRLVALQPFVEKELDSLAFPEYSEFFTHEAWTLGFTGRPGGPDWYINKQNNTLTHGPGGQHHHDLHEEADPCFAKVVKGFDEIKRIYKEDTIEPGDDWEFFFWDPVFIEKARIIPRPPELGTESAHKHHEHHGKHHVNYHKFSKPEFHFEP